MTDNEIEILTCWRDHLIFQIIKILNLYTPVNEFEERVPITFIRKIQDKLTSRHDSTQTLLMDTKFLYAITFPFNPSSVGLDTITVPVEWGLGFLKRLWEGSLHTVSALWTSVVVFDTYSSTDVVSTSDALNNFCVRCLRCRLEH